MKKLLTIAGLAIAALAAAATAGIGLPEQAHGDAGAVRTITVTGEGSVRARPDEAAFSFGVQSHADTAREASRDNAAAMRRLIGALKDAGVRPAEIQTQDASVWPDGENGGYTATGSVSVTTQIDDAGGVVDAATAAGANTMWGPGLTRSETDSLEKQALERALADARRKASALARAAGGQLGGVAKMVEGGAVEPVYANARLIAKDAATPIAAGRVETTASLTVTFEMR